MIVMMMFELSHRGHFHLIEEATYQFFIYGRSSFQCFRNDFPIRFSPLNHEDKSIEEVSGSLRVDDWNEWRKVDNYVTEIAPQTF